MYCLAKGSWKVHQTYERKQLQIQLTSIYKFNTDQKPKR